ncbi:MAG: hypothetical protein AAB385_07710, partial [Planctomycetota bacterium]
MPSNSIFHHAKGAFNLLVGSAIAVGVAGCASIPSQPMRAERYSIEVRLDPPTHTLTGRAAIDLARIDEGTATSPSDQPVSLEIRLHPDLKITGLLASGAELRSNIATPIRESDSKPSEARGADDDGFTPRRYRIVLKRPVEAMTLFI